MGRRYRKSEGDKFFEELVKQSSLVPWWLTLPVALLLLYFVPYGVPADIQMQQPPDFVNAMLMMLLKAVFKFLIPMTLAFGAVLNIYSSIKSGLLFKSIKKNGAHKTVKDLCWQDFEFLLSEWFKKDGFNTEIVGGGGADGGIDIKLHKNGELYLVQCKHYKVWKVSVQVVRELFGVMVAENAVGGYVVTSGRFTNEAETFARGKNIQLIDGNKLESILDSEDIQTIQVGTNVQKLCPKCSHNLVKRKGKYGDFFGCSTYPKCNYTEKIK